MKTKKTKRSGNEQKKGRVLARVSAADLKKVTGGTGMSGGTAGKMPATDQDSNGYDWTPRTLDGAGDTD